MPSRRSGSTVDGMNVNPHILVQAIEVRHDERAAKPRRAGWRTRRAGDGSGFRAHEQARG